jgi:hypothetical protein
VDDGDQPARLDYAPPDARPRWSFGSGTLVVAWAFVVAIYVLLAGLIVFG